jgi:hypothetical protein
VLQEGLYFEALLLGHSTASCCCSSRDGGISAVWRVR